jgi:preprotein translocase SecE subunit
MRKVAWPTRPEVINSSMVVIIAVIFMGAAIFGLDYCAAKFVLFLFG